MKGHPGRPSQQSGSNRHAPRLPLPPRTRLRLAPFQTPRIATYHADLPLVFRPFRFAPLLTLAATTHAAIRAEAYRGEPFGIGRIEIDLEPGASSVPWSDDRFALDDADGRAMYPVLENAPVRRLVRQFLGIETPWRVTFYFMFRGDEPLNLTIHAPHAQQLTLRSENRPDKFRDLQDDWWKATTGRFQRVDRQGEYPVLVENYLASTWARRLGRDMPQPNLYLLRKYRQGEPWVAQLTANEAYQIDIERELLLGRLGAGEQATIALPPSADGEVTSVTGNSASKTSTNANTSEDLPSPAPIEAIEPIAAHVPAECFYLRFGNFTNYLWFRDFLKQSRGELGNMVVLESIDYGNSNRLQQQLAVGESSTARVMGSAVIADVAIIGLDYYLRDGAAMGILFHAKNNLLLGANLNRQRHEGLAAHQDATEQTLQIAGHDVSYISTPDGKLRSYYAVDGDFHLVATSRRLVERFYEAGAGRASLAASTDFQEARVATPLARDDTILLFLSSTLLENLASPHYRIELDRRLRSIGEIRALQLARLAAQVEGRPARSVDELVAADLLPANFGQRADGSTIVESPNGFRDSLRGAAGAMLPVPDASVDKITPTEARRYAEFQQGIRSSVGRFVPISLAIKRAASPANAEWDHITADLRVAPYSQTRLVKWANMLGPAEPLRVAPIAGDIASIEIIADALGQPVHLFAGTRDFRAPLVIRAGEVQQQGSFGDYVRGYVGTWPRPFALFDTFFGRPTTQFDGEGIARNDGLFDLWQCRLDDFFLFAFSRDVLLEVGPQLEMVEPERPAQIRVQDRRPVGQTDRHLGHGHWLHAIPRGLDQRRPLHELARQPTARPALRGPRSRRAACRRQICLPPRRRLRTRQRRRAPRPRRGRFSDREQRPQRPQHPQSLGLHRDAAGKPLLPHPNSRRLRDAADEMVPRHAGRSRPRRRRLHPPRRPRHGPHRSRPAHRRTRSWRLPTPKPRQPLRRLGREKGRNEKGRPGQTRLG